MASTTTATTFNRAASEQPRPHVSFQEPESNRPHSSRPRPKHLQPLAIGQVLPRQRRHSGTYVRYPVTGNSLVSQFPHSPSEDTPSSATSLATPSLAAVRQYYKDNNLRTAFQGPQTPRAPPPTPAFNSRRSSILTPNSLTARFDKLAATSPVLGRTFRQRSIVDESRDMLLDNLPSAEASRLGSVVSSSPQSPSASRRPSQAPSLPLKPPKDRLREFGHLYLNNVLTSDVFVKALHIRKYGQEGRRDSVMSNHSEMDGDEMNVPKVGEDEEHFMLRARVIPCAKERKPFLIQRRLNKSDLKAMAKSHTVEQKGKDGEDEHGRRKSSSTGMSPKSPRSPRKVRKEGGGERMMMPIHMDYALRYLPVLGLLMLSGHIRKGDQIDLPLPHPEAWTETVAWVYTGHGTLSEGAKENLLHLGGVVDGVDEVKESGKEGGDSDSELSEPPEDV